MSFTILDNLSTLNRQAFSIMDEFKALVAELDLDDDYSPEFELIDPGVATIYAKSSRAKVCLCIYDMQCVFLLCCRRHFLHILKCYCQLLHWHD